MNLADRVLRWLHSESRFEGLSRDQALAVLDCLLAMVMADGRITEEEWARLRQEIARLPWSWDEGQDRVEARIEDARLRVERLGPELADGRFQRDVAARLTRPALRDAVYGMMVAIALSDGLEESEKARLDRFREAFDLESA